MIVTPDAARAIIEVKTNCSVNTQAKNNGPSQLVTDLRHLVKKGRLCDQALAGFDGFQKVWTGFFVFNDTNKPEDGIMDAIKTGHKATNHAVNCIVYHKKHFARYWTQEEIDKGFLPHADLNGPQWNYYHFDDGIAPSYFIGNLIDHISPIDHQISSQAWFPLKDGKRPYRKLSMAQNDNYDIADRRKN